MDEADGLHSIETLEQLDALFGTPSEAAIRKEVSFVHPCYRTLIEASPFAVLATQGPGGLDASPRGDSPGFVVVEDEKTLLLPERRGNNRVDSLRNIVADPRVALLFLIPGVGETLRVQGRATLTAEPSLLQRCAVQGNLPRCVVVIHVESVFFQCARAVHRARLWEPVPEEARGRVPSPGQILAALTDSQIDGEAYDRDLPA
ncbi:MAG: pyridoxamine 5'-phosphate oxidase family protein, partial [Acidobacteriota bacterium]